METETIVELSLGAKLKEARLRAGISEKEAADQLKITPTYIRAIEDGNYAILPTTPFVAGYLKSYARILDLDADLILSEFYLKINPVIDEEKTESKSLRKKVSLNKIQTKGWVIILIATVIVWAVAVAIFDQGGSATSSDLSQKDTPVGVNQEVAVDSEAELDDVEEVTTPEGLSEAISSEAESDTGHAAKNLHLSEADMTATNVAESHTLDAVASNGKDTLNFIFSGECWLEVTDKNGDVLAADIYQDGDVFTAEGTAPFTVMLGNVRLVSVLLNGSAYTLKPDGFRKTLRTTIGH
jgi:cytoskeleton protein RodZ